MLPVLAFWVTVTLYLIITWLHTNRPIPLLDLFGALPGIVTWYHKRTHLAVRPLGNSMVKSTDRWRWNLRNVGLAWVRHSATEHGYCIILSGVPTIPTCPLILCQAQELLDCSNSVKAGSVAPSSFFAAVHLGYSSIRVTHDSSYSYSKFGTPLSSASSDWRTWSFRELYAIARGGMFIGFLQKL